MYLWFTFFFFFVFFSVRFTFSCKTRSRAPTLPLSHSLTEMWLFKVVINPVAFKTPTCNETDGHESASCTKITSAHNTVEFTRSRTRPQIIIKSSGNPETGSELGFYYYYYYRFSAVSNSVIITSYAFSAKCFLIISDHRRGRPLSHARDDTYLWRPLRHGTLLRGGAQKCQRSKNSTLDQKFSTGV